MKIKSNIFLLIVIVVVSSCTAFKSTWNSFSSSIDAMFRKPLEIENKIQDPVRNDARLAVLWIGHSSLLIQIDDKFILTDPVFTSTAAAISKRFVEPGIDHEDLPTIDMVLISHMHVDHLSLGSLEMIEKKVKNMIVPNGGLVYVPNYDFESSEIKLWQTLEFDGIKITSTPLVHNGWRYGIDYAWMDSSYTGYLIEYNGVKVFFAGDTGYDSTVFKQTGKKFPNIDLSFFPVAPIHPREYSKSRHTGPVEAIKCFLDIKAKKMVPIHYGTFPESYDTLGEAESMLEREKIKQGLTEDELVIMSIGEQKVFIKKD